MTIGQRNWNTPTAILYPGGSTRSQSLDGFQRLTELRAKDPGQTDLMRYRYAFDAENNILRKDTEHGRYDYQYDSLYRLTAADNPVGLPAEAYGYDKLGNRLSDRRKPDPAQTGERWQYNADNQLIESATENSALLGRNSLPVAHDYDVNGSLIRKHTPAGTEASHPDDNQRFVYDAQNRLTEVQDPAGHPIASYQYDPQGRRIRKTVHRQWNGGVWESLAEARTATYVYGEEGLIAEYQAQGNNAAQLAAQYGWQPEGKWGTDPVWIKTMPAGGSQASYFYYQNDHLGTPQKIIDGQGQSVWSQKATAFGETTVDAASALVNNLRFPGQYFDAETDLHYNGFRDYDPGIGRYSESDPIGLMGGINSYVYVNGSPINTVDPFGLVKHTTGQWKECSKNCRVRIDYVLDEKTGQITRHLHWECNGDEGAFGENGDDSHGGTCDDAPRKVQECAKKHGFSCKPPPPQPVPFSCDKNCQITWKAIRDVVTGVLIFIAVCAVTLAM